ncbi:MAG: hypothetical protein O3A25_05645 [Acidobacteria bacterium]|nr:hypothetical protein [Acidobacteriota bacterium]
MLRTNLATRPFYNERAAYLGLGVLALAGLIALASLVVSVVELSRRNTELTARVEQAEQEGAVLASRTAEAQGAVSPVTLETVAAAAREANTLIDQRVFSWTQFFNRIETTLPADVMVTLVRPDIAPGSVEVTIGVVGQELDAITAFIGALEASGAFAEVLSQTAELTDDGTYQAVLRGRYLQAADPPGEVLPAAGTAQDAGGRAGSGDGTETPQPDGRSRP